VLLLSRVWAIERVSARMEHSMLHVAVTDKHRHPEDMHNNTVPICAAQFGRVSTSDTWYHSPPVSQSQQVGEASLVCAIRDA
jgi:hypothetical protein